MTLARDLPTQKAGTEGTIRGLTPSALGVTYAVKFPEGMRIVGERDLQSTP